MVQTDPGEPGAKAGRPSERTKSLVSLDKGHLSRLFRLVGIGEDGQAKPVQAGSVLFHQPGVEVPVARLDFPDQFPFFDGLPPGALAAKIPHSNPV